MANQASNLGGFPRYTTKVSSSDEAAKANAASWEPVMQRWNSVMEWAAQEGPEKHVEYVSRLADEHGGRSS